MLPHFANPDSKCDCGYVLHENYMGCIAEVKYSVDGDQADNPPRPAAQANACLIAAAPDLLAAVEALRASVRDTMLPALNRSGEQLWMAEAVALGGLFKRVDAAIAKARGES